MRDAKNDQAHEFRQVANQYEGMIYNLIQKLNIHDRDGEFYQAGLIALWESYQKYSGRDYFPQVTYITIKSRLIDLIRKNSRIIKHETTSEYMEVPGHNQLIDNYDPDFWKIVYEPLTAKQQIYVKKKVVEGMSLKEIAEEQDTTVDAVKGWGKEVRRKLRPILKSYLTPTD
ncbi:sigma-70 family RNA polymerase sigma factor [Tenuibacillus multivorans]|uniref:RNA polymerase sigma factor, sigma-70 family n=1 Tax=Tenuibacillus multivorans TaxID=237069 RepID=A0A1H0AVV5_9BACI|nr:sigma-70 family RNA polymerase sigma factor [Tenuibacillus multivorans]GEL77795.1 hypothetical protein TMU01_20300 [Tenuibacillus multivorans]SDN37582.1 RNA polymerase sigma factor, sigma-70 family [Tenuibacillus multivorans]